VTALFTARADLDRWADVLGVRNDQDATARVRRLCSMLDDVADDCQHLSRLLSGAPDEDVARALGRITVEADRALDGLLVVHRGFVVHERGGRR
jgi:hypothetical protein